MRVLTNCYCLRLVHIVMVMKINENKVSYGALNKFVT